MSQISFWLIFFTANVFYARHAKIYAKYAKAFLLKRKHDLNIKFAKLDAYKALRTSIEDLLKKTLRFSAKTVVNFALQLIFKKTLSVICG